MGTRGRHFSPVLFTRSHPPMRFAKPLPHTTMSARNRTIAETLTYPALCRRKVRPGAPGSASGSLQSGGSRRECTSGTEQKEAETEWRRGMFDFEFGHEIGTDGWRSLVRSRKRRGSILPAMSHLFLLMRTRTRSSMSSARWGEYSSSPFSNATDPGTG